MNRLDAQRSVKPVSIADDTKHIIVQTALRMFAQRGIEGVSLSELRSASGQNNRSAIHYHFGNKDGLLDAVTDRLSEMLGVPMKEGLESGKHLAASGELTIESFMRVMSHPFVELYKQGQEGHDCLRMLSHLSHEMTDRQQARAFTPIQDYMGEMARLLQGLMPDKKPSELAPMMFMSSCSFVEILICSHMLTRDHTLAGDQVTAPSKDVIVEMALKFITGGFVAASQRA